MKKEMVVDYFPLRTEEMVTEFCESDNDTLVLDANYAIVSDAKASIFPTYALNGNYNWTAFHPNKKRVPHSELILYKIYYLISKDYDQYGSYSLPYDEISIKLKKGYPTIFNFNKIIYFGKDMDITENISHKVEYTITELKSHPSGPLSQVMGREIFGNKTKLKGKNIYDIHFKAPFKLIAKNLIDARFNRKDGVKDRPLLIEGLRLVRKEKYRFGRTFIDEIYYFPEKYPDLCKLVE